MRLLGPWIHNDDPVSSLHFQADLEKIRLACRQGPFFENLIREYLLDNPHRVSLLLKPDPDQEEREQKETESYLKKLRSGFTEKETEDLIARAEALQSFQEQEEDVSILPTLELDDIPEKEEFYPRTEDRVAGSPVFFLEQPTNGIGYFSAYVSLQGLADNLKALSPGFLFSFNPNGGCGLRLSDPCGKNRCPYGRDSRRSVDTV